MPEKDAHPDVSILAEEVQLGILNALDEGICFVSMSGVVCFWNTAAESITGISKPEAISARDVNEILVFCDGHGEPCGHPSPPAVATQESKGFDTLFLRHKEGHQVPVRIRWIAVRGEDQRLIGTSALFHRSGEEVSPADELETREVGGREDGDTEAFVTEHLERRLQHREASPAGVLLATIDAAHDYENRLGHELAVRLARMVARTVALSLEPGDSSGIWEDHSVLVLSNTTDQARLGDLAARIRGLAQASGVAWWGEIVKPTLTIAATIMHPSDTSQSLLRRLKESAKTAQAQGGNSVVLV